MYVCVSHEGNVIAINQILLLLVVIVQLNDADAHYLSASLNE